MVLLKKIIIGIILCLFNLDVFFFIFLKCIFFEFNCKLKLFLICLIVLLKIVFFNYFNFFLFDKV